MEYFRIETLEELKQAYNQLKWHPEYDLQKEIDAFEILGHRSIRKNYDGYHYIGSDSWNTIYDTEISSPLKKYNVKCKGVEIDVYDVLKAFDVQCPATQHAIKKLLKTGKRGHKDAEQDLSEAIESINRAKELRNE